MAAERCAIYGNNSGLTVHGNQSVGSGEGQTTAGTGALVDCEIYENRLTNVLVAFKGKLALTKCRVHDAVTGVL